MTPEETREAGRLMIDWADGKCEVEVVGRVGHCALPRDVPPRWNWVDCDYRRKPTPTLRPYTAEECVGLVGQVVKRKADYWRCYAVDAVSARDAADASSDHYIDTRITLRPLDENVHHNEYVSPVGLLNYRRDDGSRCGVEEE